MRTVEDMKGLTLSDSTKAYLVAYQMVEDVATFVEHQCKDFCGDSIPKNFIDGETTPLWETVELMQKEILALMGKVIHANLLANLKQL